MKAGEITEYDGQYWRIDEASDGFFDVMALDLDDRSPWQEIPDIMRCYLCRELIPHSERLHEATMQYHSQVELMREKVLNEIAAGIMKPEATYNQVAAMIYD